VESGTVVAIEEDATGLTVIATVDLHVAGELTVGREGDIPLGAVPADGRVSRQAATVARTPDGWRVTTGNRNGVRVQPWAQAPRIAQPVELLGHDYVALAVVGDPARRHWLLLQDASLAASDRGRSTLRTELRMMPRPLTAPQVEVVECMFGQLLSWPPVMRGEPLQLKQVARQIGVSVSGVQARLVEVRAKAQAVDALMHHVRLTDPAYIHALAAAGYLTPREHLKRRW
jgi:hypothetical protein